MSGEFLSCGVASICSGCDWIAKPLSEQREAKIATLRDLLPWYRGPISFRSCGLGGTRDRIDLTLSQGRLGLFDQARTGLVDLDQCPQLSPALEKWLQDFRSLALTGFAAISRGSIRLRVSPAGDRGVWLDFANIDIKTLLDDQHALNALLDAGVIVEIGQRRKRLVRGPDRLRLNDPVLHPWFESEGLPLYCTIGSFTQPGFAVNRELVGEVLDFAEGVATSELSSQLSPRLSPADCVSVGHAAEFGAGIGNFTLPLAKKFAHVDAYEIDRLALEGLSRSLDEQGLREKVEIHAGNFQGDKALELDFAKTDLLLVDPPRSGLMKFVEPVSKARNVIYVSCFAESFAADATYLRNAGLKLERLSIVDQFPQSRHYEIVALFRV